MPTIRRDRTWLATWLQGRRRKRLAGVVEPQEEPTGLEAGLVEFYQPEAGATFVRSFDESRAPDAVPYTMQSLEESEGEGSYPEGTALEYFVMPYRTVDGVRVYGSCLLQHSLGVTVPDAGVLWPGGGEAPAWVTGYCVLRWVNYSTRSHRYFSVAGMLAGWLDNGTSGWIEGLPATFAAPPDVLRVMWSRDGTHSAPSTMPTVLSPLGGWAFDSTTGHQLCREMCDGLRRMPEATMAYWLCPADGSGGVLSSLRGVFLLSFGGNYSCSVPDFVFAEAGEASVADHQDGDWYLVVLRNDPLEELCKVDLVRLRDEAQFSASATLNAAALTVDDDFFYDGLLAVLVLGCSWHWGVQGYGYYDRLGVWDRALTDEEILDLFNSGLGWVPGQ